MEQGIGKDLLNGFGTRSLDSVKYDVSSLRQNGVSDCVANGNGVANGNCSRRKRETTTKRSRDDADVADDENENEAETFVPTRLQLVTDWANLCTLLGAVLATIAMACMWKKRYYAGMVLNVLANIADILDGPIARSTPHRQPAFAKIGSKLDCYSDTVSHFVVPASLLMNLSDLHPVCVALAAAYVCAGIVRQSYFEVTGRCENGSCVYGVTSDYMVAVYAVAMHLAPAVGTAWMPGVMGAVVTGMTVACLTFAVRSRRYEGLGLATAAAFNALLCLSCLALAVFADADDGGFVFESEMLFVILLSLAYPMYFRFVEINR